MAESIVKRKRPFKDIGARIGSILAILAICLIPLYLGGYWFFALLLMIGLRIVLEWVRMSDANAGKLAYAVPMIGMVAALILASQGLWMQAFVSIPITMTLCLIEQQARAKLTGGEDENLGALLRCSLGYFYMVIPCLAILYVRGMDPKFIGTGLEKILFVVGIVAAADIFAYLGGSMMRGPKIAPKLSPNKTWSGFLSGLLFGSIAGAFGAQLLGFSPWLGLMLAVPIVIFSVIGDFLESGLKRRFNVKDTGKLLPGHGGVLDRMDALMFAMTIFAIAMVVRPHLWPVG
jgi:phosphatidate cytidylyltransferase